jgi:two-component system, chemotaxis family, chemotaxis protein CheY
MHSCIIAEDNGLNFDQSLYLAEGAPVYRLGRSTQKGAAVSISSQSVPAQSGAQAGGERRSLQLLIVDDDAGQRMLISLAAKHAGHVVTLAQSCAEAIKQIQSARFDCVTLDLMLGDGEGVEVLKAMANAKFAGSVIIISGMNAARRIAARSYARSLGIELQSLPKPVDLAALRICLANLCKTAMGLPVMHMWGGVVVDDVAEQHRS